MAVLGPTGKGHHHHIYTTRDIQNLQRWAERVRDVTSALKANVDVMTSLRRFYIDLRDNDEFPMKKSCGDDIAVFASQLGNLIDDFRLQIDRADALVRITTDRTELVKQHRLERLNLNMESEAIIVRIITIVTLIYLPATFVSTFFSTDVVKFQGQEQEGANFSSLAMVRWVQVTLPLTALTIAFAYLWKGLAERRWQREVLPMDAEDLRRPRWISEKWKWRPRERKASSSTGSTV
jgi:Mg2+ and Co2+ transporter CorA